MMQDAQAIRDRTVAALYDQAAELGRSGRMAEAIAAYDELLHRLGEAGEPAAQGLAAKALVNKGTCLGALGRAAEALWLIHI
jgi:hypothetical protein